MGPQTKPSIGRGGGEAAEAGPECAARRPSQARSAREGTRTILAAATPRARRKRAVEASVDAEALIRSGVGKLKAHGTARGSVGAGMHSARHLDPAGTGRVATLPPGASGSRRACTRRTALAGGRDEHGPAARGAAPGDVVPMIRCQRRVGAVHFHDLHRSLRRQP